VARMLRYTNFVYQVADIQRYAKPRS
jgi:hypothetical protein